MGFVSPTLPDLDVDRWRALPRAERTKALQQHWTLNGFGTPYAIYLLYLLKIGLYILGGLAFAAATPGLGTLGNVGDWWTEPVVFQKVIVWTLLFEVLGFGCGFGPLTLRFLPPIGTFLYWLRPGTIRLPPWPDRVPLTRGSSARSSTSSSTLAVLAAAMWILLAPADRAGDVQSMIEPARFVPLVVLLPLLGLRDKTIFLAARAEHYWVTTLVFFLPFVDMVLAAKLIMLALWWGAATSKLNKHFPFVVATMLSNAPLVLRPVKRLLWRDVETDVRPFTRGDDAGALGHGRGVLGSVGASAEQRWHRHLGRGDRDDPVPPQHPVVDPDGRAAGVERDDDVRRRVAVRPATPRSG